MVDETRFWNVHVPPAIADASNVVMGISAIISTQTESARPFIPPYSETERPPVIRYPNPPNRVKAPMEGTG